MKTTLLTVGVLGFLSGYSLFLGYSEFAFFTAGALVGYLGKLNGAVAVMRKNAA